MFMLRKFLCCFPLETGGLIVCWTCCISYLMLCLLWLHTIVILPVEPEDEPDSGKPWLCFSGNVRELFMKEKKYQKKIFYLLCALYISAGLAWSSYSATVGIKLRQPYRLMCTAIMLALVTVIASLNFLLYPNMDVHDIIGCLFVVAVLFYAFFTVCSLFCMIRKDLLREEGSREQYCIR